jgi:hypothetical protein
MIEMVMIIVAIYLVMGILFVIPFLVKGITKVDEGAHGGSFGFKMIIIPGVIVFWPVLLRKWMHKPPSPKGV